MIFALSSLLAASALVGTKVPAVDVRGCISSVTCCAALTHRSVRCACAARPQLPAD
jgi:hypothetical protein